MLRALGLVPGHPTPYLVLGPWTRPVLVLISGQLYTIDKKQTVATQHVTSRLC